MKERGVELPDVLTILARGHRAPELDVYDPEQGIWKYAFIGGGKDEEQSLMVSVAFDEDTGMIIITVIDMGD